MNPPNAPEQWPIYNCHIHTFTKQHTPNQFIKWVLSDADKGRINWWMMPVYLLAVIAYLGVLILLAKATIFLSARADLLSLFGYSFLLLLQAVLVIPIVLLVVILIVVVAILLRQNGTVRSKLLFELLVHINPASNDIFERTARFLKISEQPMQQDVFRQVESQYPNEEAVKTVFVVLPMDMGFMDLGKLDTPIEDQHDELLKLSKSPGRHIIPFYAADPRHPDIVERVRSNLARDKFQGIKIYPNLGYKPDDEKLMEIYKLCIAGDFPVVTHCSPGGIWKYGLSRKERRANSEPLNYKRILDTPGYQTLKLNLAHFGGAEEWKKHLSGRSEEGEEKAWVKTIYEMITSGHYPNLYTDISYTAFTPKVAGLYIDLVDYLKVLLSHPLLRKRVLFGSDYYMVERESVSEKEVSILLRSRLGEDLYKQIAYTNPREFLNIEVPAPTTVVKKKRSTRKSLLGDPLRSGAQGALTQFPNTK